METQDERLVQVNEGDGSTDSSLPNLSPTGDSGQRRETLGTDVPAEEGEPGVHEQVRTPPTGYEGVPPELWPDENGKPPELTPTLLASLRGKYFTVRHPLLKECGHKIDMIAEPRHRNCENCWWTFFNTHPQLVETADQFFRTQGKKAMVGMRGDQFVKMFVRYMATVIHFMKQEGRLPNEFSNQQPNSEVVADRPEVSGLGSGLIAE